MKKLWTKPFIKQWPLMVAYIVLIGWISVTKNPIPRWFIIFLHAYLAAALVTWANNKIVKAIVYLVIYVLFVTEIILQWLFGMNISPNVLTLLVETNAQESAEFIESLHGKPQLWQIPACLISMIIANIFLERNRQYLVDKIKRTRAPKYLKILAVLLLIGGVVFSYNYVNLLKCQEMNEVDEWRSHMRNPDDLVTKLMVSFYDMSLSKKEMENVIILTEQAKASISPQADDSLNVIFIIGESFMPNHASLYGYPLKTTPFLDSEQAAGRLFPFTDVLSPYNQTTRVIRNLLSCNSIGDGESWASAPAFTALYKKSGYHVAFYDNQKAADMGHSFTYSLNTYLYHPRIAKACYDELNDSTFEFDGQLIDYYRRQQSSQQASHRLVLFHLMGQHVSFEHRYPEGFGHFTSDSTQFRKESWLTEEMRQDIAHYDNAILYNDYVLQQITSLYDKENTIVIFLSDHGEEVYDYRDNLGRDDWSIGSDPKQVLYFQYRVPLIVWCSNQFVSRHPDMVSQLKQALHRPFMIDNTCQLLFYLSGLNTSYYHPQRNVLSPEYHCPPRIINDKFDGDSILQ